VQGDHGPAIRGPDQIEGPVGRVPPFGARPGRRARGLADGRGLGGFDVVGVGDRRVAG